jgi:hypothetical protein
MTIISSSKHLNLSFCLLLAITRSIHANLEPDAPRTAIRYKIADVGNTILTQSRRCLNFNNIFGSASSVPAYDRIIAQPVFAVTTPWGSPYLLFEQKDATETSLEFDESKADAGGDDALQQKPRGRDSNTNQVALYFLDEHDAMQLRDEMLQMDQMKGADMRITTLSLGKALRQASHLNHGLLTGQPIDDLTGKLPAPQEGGSLRYKIVPPRKELFYAARCKGRERVGLFGSTPAVDARLMLSSFSTIGGVLRKRRVEAKNRESSSKKEKTSKDAPSQDKDSAVETDPIRKAYSHMNGFAGIPVFYSPDLRLSNGLKGLLRMDRRKRIPLFFSYEDLMNYRSMSISKIKGDARTKALNDVPDVEVFNLMDVVTSMDQEDWHVRRSRYQGILNLLKRKDKTKQKISFKGSELQNIVFIPNSHSVRSKELTSRMGSTKVKLLRPMRAWGKDA